MPPPISKSGWYQDVAIVRFRPDSEKASTLGGIHAKVVFYREFVKMFEDHRPNDNFWKEISMIQCAGKSKTGSGTPIFVEFKAPIDLNKPDAVIDYGVDKFPSDYSLLLAGDDQQYALKQCHVMAHWLQETRG